MSKEFDLISRCLVCGKENSISKGNDNSNIILLNDSRYIHQSCLKKSEKKLHELKIEVNNLLKQINYHSSSFWNIFFGKATKIINDLKTTYNNKKISYEKLYRGFDKVCIFYPGYPPDWHKRREKVIKRDGKKCVKCGNSFQLQVHHKIELKKGGSNSLENLTTLCNECHLKEHKTKFFKGKHFEPNQLSSFHEKHKLLQNCIDENLKINFHYWKWKKKSKNWVKETSTRHIRPHKIDIIKDGFFQKSDGSGLYVYGYDFDREAERFFDISKISKIKKISYSLDTIF